MAERIGFLATGTELIQGDILNTNTQVMARELHELYYVIGNHMIVSDEQVDIAHALQHLLLSHDVILVTGGLGPTSDDRTRFALADVIDQPLVLHAASWEHITDRITRRGLTITENNRQQAMFPAEAIIFENPNGTANGCKVSFTPPGSTLSKIIYLLPGPPKECLPMFQHDVLPDLKQYVTPRPCFRKKWHLQNVSESYIAHELETALVGFNVVTGYRVDSPYLEFKIEADLDIDITALMNAVMPIITPYL